MMNASGSSFLEGSIRHRRMTPIEHAFTYPIGLYAVDLADWKRLDRLSPWVSTRHLNMLWFRRRDYFQPGNGDLDACVRRQVYRATGWLPEGRIELITHPRYFGYCFNPVSFYFCYDSDTDETNPVPKAILAQITNTPWHERHTYCLYGGRLIDGARGWQTRRYRFAKHFHVSPFNPMDQDYDWLFSFAPGQVRIHMNVERAGDKVFDATLEVRRHPLDRRTMQYSLRHYPVETIKAGLGIYCNAWKLKRRGAVFHDHPGAASESSVAFNDDVSGPVYGLADRGTVTSWKM